MIGEEDNEEQEREIKRDEKEMELELNEEMKENKLQNHQSIERSEHEHDLQMMKIQKLHEDIEKLNRERLEKSLQAQAEMHFEEDKPKQEGREMEIEEESAGEERSEE